MIDVVSVENMRISDSFKCNEVSSLFLMYNASLKIYESFDWGNNTLIVCGSGNNGGDGFALASILKANGFLAKILIISDKMSNDASYYYNICVKNGIEIIKYNDEFVFDGYDTIVDAIFGTGYKGDVSGIYLDVINKINKANSFVISVDINSGLNGDNGLTNCAIKSDLTMSIGTYKTGHFLNMAKDYIKNKINLDIDIKIIEEPYHLLEEKDLANVFKKRAQFSNKGDYGYVGLIGGSIEYSGAIRLALMSTISIISGAGVSICACPKSVSNIVANNILEATLYPFDDNDGKIIFDEEKIKYLMNRCKVISFGMGIGRSDDGLKILKYLIENYDKKLIIDADGLSLLRDIKESLADSKAKIVLTPHLKEFSRLIDRDINDILNNSIEYALEFAKSYNVILLLKGPTTIITDGNDVLLVDKGTSGMATAGSGDVLSGIITGILGYTDDILLGSAASAFVGGMAGEYAELENSDISMTSKDTANNVKKVISNIVRNNRV